MKKVFTVVWKGLRFLFTNKYTSGLLIDGMKRLKDKLTK